MALTFKSVGRAITKGARIAAPVVGMINPAAGAALGVVGGLGHGKDSLKKMAGGGLSGGGGAMLGKAVGIGGAATGAASAASTGGKAMGWADRLRSVGGYIKNNPDLMLAGVNAVQGARAQGKADKLNAEALALAKARDAELAPLRQGALSRLTNTQRPDLSHIYAGSSNPFARPLRPLSPSMGAETPRGPMAADPMERPLREITEPPLPRPGGLRRMR